MKPVAQWFSPLAAYQKAADTDGPYQEGKWYQRCYERWTSHTRLNIGDLYAEMERDTGEHAGISLINVSVHLWENCGQFDTFDFKSHEHHQYTDHSVQFLFWRWGVGFAWRGRRRA